MRLAPLGLAIALACSTAPAATPTPSQRTLSFEDRVAAQAAIERVYYAHQLGPTKPFDEAVPKSVLEGKVRKYLDQTAALGVYWKTSVTDEMLQRELERMANGTKMPERLTELYAALGNDPFLIKECLARAMLVDRLTHNFFAFDSTIHAKAREEAEALHRRLASGELSVSAEEAHRTVSEFVLDENAAAVPSHEQPRQRRLTAKDFRDRRAQFPTIVGQPSELTETRDAFVWNVLLSESASDLRVARYAVPKTTWDDWWSKLNKRLPAESVAPVAAADSTLPKPAEPRAPNGTPCTPDDSWNNGSLSGSPSARSGHAAVWTGSLMIVWGGVDESDSPVDGGRYDPATDSWTPVSPYGAPSASSNPAALWTGHLMLFWTGGISARYDPATDRWTPMSAIGAPSGGGAVWTGSEMIVWGVGAGGRYNPETDRWTRMSTTGAPKDTNLQVWTGSLMVVWSRQENTGGRYDPASDSWMPMSGSNSPTDCGGDVAVWTGRQMLLWCENYHLGETRNFGGGYDPISDSWSSMSSAGPVSSGGYSAVWTGQSMIVWGGYNRRHYFDDAPHGLGSGSRYDPATDTWTPLPGKGAPSGRAYHSAVWTGTSMIVWGGDGGIHEGGVRRTGGRYDPATESWTPTSTDPPDAPSARTDHTAVWTGSVMVVWGGASGYDLLLNTGGQYDPTTDSWTPTSTVNAPAARSLHTAVWTGSEMIAWGGRGEDPTDLGTGGRYDPTADRWAPTSTADAPTGRVYHTSVWDGSEMIVWGGDDTSGPTNTGARYDPVADKWTPTAMFGAPARRDSHIAVWTGSRMVVWGGYALDADSTTGGRYDPVADIWTSTSTSGAPIDYGASAVWTGSLMLVWNGYGGGRYEPVADSWTPMSVLDPPSYGANPSAVWTGSEMVVWGGGGWDEFGVGRGGRYDPERDLWRPTTGLGAPAPRHGQTAVWTGSSMIVWGGESGGGSGPDQYLGTGGMYFVVDSPTADHDCDGFSSLQGDCDDTNATIYPDAPQLCDGLNNDCNDPGWPSVPPNEVDQDGDGFPLCAGDCDDTNPSIHPRASEVCNGIDDNCDGVVDEGNDLLCSDRNLCTSDSCHGASGCEFVANNRACDDFDACTINDTCQLGYCWGTEKDCDDGNSCTDDWCDDDYGCEHWPRDGACDDGNPCTGGDFCDNGACQPGTSDGCDDGNPCTDDSCDVLTGCAHTLNSNPCDDGNVCTLGDVCVAGVCLPSEGSLYCNDNNVCTTDVCNPYVGCVFLDDPNLCDDHNPCTDDSCDPITGCSSVNAANACSDGNACTAGDFCLDGVCISGPPEVCHDNNPCTDDRCDPATGCFFPNNRNPCSDNNACTKGDTCEDGYCEPGTPIQCDDGNPCTSDSCDSQIGCIHTPNQARCDDGNACTYGDVCSRGVCKGFPVGCDDNNPCTNDSCDPAIGCVYTNRVGSCSDGNACTTFDRCVDGECRGSDVLDCDDKNVCTTDTCNATTGCVHTNNTNSCNDRDACTQTDACVNGVCVGGNPVTCGPPDQCHEAGVCVPATGACAYPNKTDGTACDDGSLCTRGETCQSGACTAAINGLDNPAPKSSGYYKTLCEKRAHNQLPFQGDQLTDADATCVGTLISTFAGISTIDGICDVLGKSRHGGRHHGGHGSGPNGRECDKGEDELMATAINVCRARVCEDQDLDSHCPGNAHSTVLQALAAADAILDDAARTRESCGIATCELREINDGHALELNSLSLALEIDRVRLTWSSFSSDDGSGTPDSYEVWRRAMGSNDAFVRIGSTQETTFLDAAAGTAAWEYDVTAVFPEDSY